MWSWVYVEEKEGDGSGNATIGLCWGEGEASKRPRSDSALARRRDITQVATRVFHWLVIVPGLEPFEEQAMQRSVMLIACWANYVTGYKIKSP